MSFTVEQKSLLAKLMATENLQVQHQKIQTAKFYPKERILCLPIWQNMSGFMYDYLTGHEVGHALYTPAEGWHDAASDKSKGKFYKNFLNVVEDCRIEKKIKRKYPGLNNSFKQGFAELMKRDFFNLAHRNINSMAFIERLNVYSKSQWTADIVFNDEEMAMVKKVQACETWEDVIAITGEVYDYSKDEQFELQKLQDFETFGDSFDDEYDYDDDSFENSDDYDFDEDAPTNKNGKSKKSDEESEETENKKSKSDGDESSDEDSEEQESDENGRSVNRFKDSQSTDRDQFNPRCETDENFRQNENTLLDAKCKEYVYVKVPKANFANIIVPAATVQKAMTDYYAEMVKNGYYTEADIQALVNDFKNKNDRYIGLLAKEFEMRKAAKAFSKSKLSDTGDIDINKLASYKFDDNIFRKVMMVPKGKNHGLILLLDCSGSMSNNMAGSIEQILVLAMFCRKVNIPFIVYGFNDNEEAHLLDLGIDKYDYEKRNEVIRRKCFSDNVGEVSLGTMYLREYLNSRMSNAEFSKSLRNMVTLKKSYEGRYGNRFGRPDNEHLSNTPLTQAVFAVGQLMPEFRRKFNIDMTSLVIVHDGDSDRCNSMYQMREQHNYKTGQNETVLGVRGFDTRYSNVVLTDAKNKYQFQIPSVTNEDSNYRQFMLEAALDWFTKTTNSKVFGFFLIVPQAGNLRSAVYNRYVFEDGTTFNQLRKISQQNGNGDYQEKQKEIIRKIKAEKFVSSKIVGYNEFYLVAGGTELMTEEDELEIDGKVTAGKLKNAFMKLNKKKQVSRVLVSRFIQGIAA